jgi:hypothetical protein
MRQAPLLELDGVHQRHWLPKDLLHFEVVQELFNLTFEDSRYYVRPVFGLLSRKQVLEDVRVPRIASERDEQIRLAMLANNSHSFLISRMQISGGARERCGQDDRNPYATWRTCISCEDVVT